MAHRILPVALASLMTLATAAPHEAQAAPPSAQLDPGVEDLLRRGKSKYEVADYEQAVDLWTQAYEQIPPGPEFQTRKAALMYDLSSALEKQFEIEGEVKHLKRAKMLLENYRAALPAIYTLESDRLPADQRAASRIAQLDEKIAAAEGTAAPVVVPAPAPTPNPTPAPAPATAPPTAAAEAAPAPEPAPAPQPAPDPVTPDPAAEGPADDGTGVIADPKKHRTGRALRGLGGGLVAVGAASTVLIIAGTATRLSAKNRLDKHAGGATLSPAEDARLRKNYSAGGKMMYAGIFMSAIALPSGIALMVVGSAMKSSAMAIAPVASPNSAGLVLSGKF